MLPDDRAQAVMGANRFLSYMRPAFAPGSGCLQRFGPVAEEGGVFGKEALNRQMGIVGTKGTGSRRRNRPSLPLRPG